MTALLLAGLDGIQSRIDPGDPLDKNLYELPPEEMAKVPQVPGSLSEAIVHLEQGGDYGRGPARAVRVGDLRLP